MSVVGARHKLTGNGRHTVGLHVRTIQGMSRSLDEGKV